MLAFIFFREDILSSQFPQLESVEIKKYYINIIFKYNLVMRKRKVFFSPDLIIFSKSKKNKIFYLFLNYNIIL